MPEKKGPARVLGWNQGQWYVVAWAYRERLPIPSLSGAIGLQQDWRRRARPEPHFAISILDGVGDERTEQWVAELFDMAERILEEDDLAYKARAHRAQLLQETAAADARPMIRTALIAIAVAAALVALALWAAAILTTPRM